MTHPELFISLDVNEIASQTALEIKHLDTSKALKVALMDNGVPYLISDSSRAIFVASKPDGTFIINECSIEDNFIFYNVTSQTTAETGTIECEIRLTDENDDVLLISPRFTIFVVPTIYEGGGAATASKNEFDALSKLLTESEMLVEEMKNVLTKQVLPQVSSEDDGAFLRVVNGGWSKTALPIAEEVSF